MHETKQTIYDELSRILTDYEHFQMDVQDSCQMLYDVLVKIQKRWEDTITAEED